MEVPAKMMFRRAGDTDHPAEALVRAGRARAVLLALVLTFCPALFAQAGGYLITTVAGSGAPGSSGDNGPATAAQLSWPSGVALDAAGNLYIADLGASCVRKVSNGVITAVAGNGTQGFSGDNGPATSAQLHYPNAVAVDSAGNLYIADFYNNRIRKVSNGVITTVAGNGTKGLSGDGGPATSAQLNEPAGVAMDPSGNLFVADSANARIRQLVAPPTSTVGCVYSIDQAAQSFGTGGGSGSVGVLASGTSCPWLAISYAGWITVSPSGVASGTGLVAYTVSPNPDSASRTGTVWIAGKSLIVNQSGVVCSLGAAPRSVSVAASGLTASNLAITSDAPDCQWTAVANVPWILVSGGNTGAGSGTVTYTVGANTGTSRTGTITVAGQKVYVNQAASGAPASSLASLDVGGIVNAASNSPPIAPGSFVSIYGGNLADTATDWSSAIVNGKLPTSLGGVQVLVDGKNAFISYVQPTQVNVLTPPDSAVGPVEVDIITSHGTVVATANMAGISPALFTYSLQGLYADALFATDYAYVATVGALPGVTSRPAKAGDYILVFATGLGQTNPPYPVGQVLTAAYPVPDLSKVSVLIDGHSAPVQFAGMTYAGVFQINIQVPSGIPAGDQPIVLGVAGQAALLTVYLTFGGG